MALLRGGIVSVFSFFLIFHSSAVLAVTSKEVIQRAAEMRASIQRENELDLKNLFVHFLSEVEGYEEGFLAFQGGAFQVNPCFAFSGRERTLQNGSLGFISRSEVCVEFIKRRYETGKKYLEKLKSDNPGRYQILQNKFKVMKEEAIARMNADMGIFTHVFQEISWEISRKELQLQSEYFDENWKVFYRSLQRRLSHLSPYGGMRNAIKLLGGEVVELEKVKEEEVEKTDVKVGEVVSKIEDLFIENVSKHYDALAVYQLRKGKTLSELGLDKEDLQWNRKSVYLKIALLYLCDYADGKFGLDDKHHELMMVYHAQFPDRMISRLDPATIKKINEEILKTKLGYLKDDQKLVIIIPHAGHVTGATNLSYGTTDCSSIASFYFGDAFCLRAEDYLYIYLKKGGLVPEGYDNGDGKKRLLEKHMLEVKGLEQAFSQYAEKFVLVEFVQRLQPGDLVVTQSQDFMLDDPEMADPHVEMFLGWDVFGQKFKAFENTRAFNGVEGVMERVVPLVRSGKICFFLRRADLESETSTQNRGGLLTESFGPQL